MANVRCHKYTAKIHQFGKTAKLFLLFFNAFFYLGEYRPIDITVFDDFKVINYSFPLA